MGIPDDRAIKFLLVPEGRRERHVVMDVHDVRFEICLYVLKYRLALDSERGPDRAVPAFWQALSLDSWPDVGEVPVCEMHGYAIGEIESLRIFRCQSEQAHVVPLRLQGRCAFQDPCVVRDSVMHYGRYTDGASPLYGAALVAQGRAGESHSSLLLRWFRRVTPCDFPRFG